jgi:hypothetical protein
MLLASATYMTASFGIAASSIASTKGSLAIPRLQVGLPYSKAALVPRLLRSNSKAKDHDYRISSSFHSLMS